MTTLPPDLKKACEEMAEKYATSEKLPTKREWIETNGGEHGQYLSYEVRWFVVDAFCAGFDAAYELMSKEIESMDDKLKGMACEHNDRPYRRARKESEAG